MRKLANSVLLGSALLSMLVLPAVSHATDPDPGNQYCVTPPFVSGNISPNLLLMIDNSASMYDLAFVDKGKKHCSSTTTQSCFLNSDCPSGETCSFFDRQPYYCFDQTYTNTDSAGNANTYAGYFKSDTYYTYDATADGFAPSAAAFPDGCGTHGGTTKKDNNNTFCVEYTATTPAALKSFVAKGNYLNWLAASKFDVEKQILTGGKVVNRVCTKNVDKACAVDEDCTGSTGPCIDAGTTFLQPESRGCVGRSFIKDAITSNFVNYNAPATNNPNTQMAITFAVRGPINPNNITAPSTGGQTFIDLYASNKKYDYASCQKAITDLASTTVSNATVKQDVAACLSGSAQGTCSEPPTSGPVSCFSTYPDCYVPGRCSADTTKTCLSTADCGVYGTCSFSLYCEGNNGVITNIPCTTAGANASQCPSTKYLCDEGNPSPYTSPNPISVSCTQAEDGQTTPTTGGSCSATYWCDYSTPSFNAKACNGPSDTTTCYSSNNQNGKCAGSNAACQGTIADPGHDPKCPGDHTCLGWISQGSHSCVIHTPSHGTCRSIQGATNGICGGQKDYGVCTFGSTDPLTKTKVNFQQTMQACWQYNRFRAGVGGASDVGIDDLKTMDKQCMDIYNGTGGGVAYMTCSNDHLKTCTSSTVATDCGSTTATCDSGPAAIDAGSPALICGASWEGQLYKLSSGSWVKKGSFNDNTNSLAALSISTPSLCASTDTFSACVKKIYQAFCVANQVPGVADPTDAPSDTSTYDNLPAILNGVGVEAQLGSPIAKLRARLAISTPACTKDSDCSSGYSCVSSVCKPAGLVQQFGSQIRLGAMSFNRFGSSSETALAGVKVPRVCANDATKTCTIDIDCAKDGTIHCIDTSAADNLDGGHVIYPVGLGVCATMNSTPCNVDSDCVGWGGSCINRYCGTKTTTPCTTALTCTGTGVLACARTSPGDHATAGSLVQTLDAIAANAWTPFAETLYNAIGYFAAIPQTNGSFKSRVTGASTDTNVTNVRLNSTDFDETKNPSEYRCQQNHVLLVTDGSSTTDRNSTVSGLATLYATKAGTSAVSCPAVNGVDYGGSSNLPIISWIGRRENLASFSTSTATPVYCSIHTTTTCSSDSDCPSGETCANGRNPRDYVNTWVVLNGADNASAGACDAQVLLGKTATNGGTQMKLATDPKGLSSALTNIFQNIAAKASSGTAASILSNSEGSGANILQAVFYPKKIFDNQTFVNWIGEMQNLWYFVDPLINHSTIREDTNADRTLDLVSDSVVSLRFDATDNTTYAYTSTDSNGDGLGDSAETKEDADLVKSIWRAGKQLWQRDLTVSPRKLYTPKLTGGSEVTGTGLMTFTWGSIGSTTFADNSAALQPFLQVTDNAGAVKLMKFVHGFDFPSDANMRNRTVQIGSIPSSTVGSSLYVSNPRDKGIGVWKLGDIISSTPRIQSNVRLNGYGLMAPAGYSDASYSSFIASNQYKSRGMVYVGANDGMLHAFKLGTLDVTASGYRKAKLTGDDLGEEQWAFMPKQVLPFLNYLSAPLYNHIYFMDGSTVLVDASIGNNGQGCGTGTSGYKDCTKPSTVVDSGNDLTSANPWRTVLIGGMGLGGASASSCASGSNCVQTPLSSTGYSAYYALDITDPDNPKYMWEFTNTALGYATTGPAIVRVGDQTKNGRWFAVFGSGPTGPIDTSYHQFMGLSNQTLQFFVVDLATGTLVKTIDTGIANAFAGSMIGGSIDADRWNTSVAGNYQDDAIYVGYTKKSGTTWTDGGVLRIVTNESTDPNDTAKPWTWSTVIDGVGPVTSAISRLQDRKNRNLWLYFGTGRFYSRVGGTIDDNDSLRAIYGVKERCYNTYANPGNLLDKSCTSSTDPADLTDQSTSITSADSISRGWKVTLGEATGSFGAERVVTDAVALTNGTIFVTSFMPTTDPCGFGGNSYLWALDYASGGRPSDAALGGKALIQLSTGEFKEVDLSQAFGAGAARLMRRTSAAMTGKPPADAFPVISKSANKPVKRILHIQER